MPTKPAYGSLSKGVRRWQKRLCARRVAKFSGAKTMTNSSPALWDMRKFTDANSAMPIARRFSRPRTWFSSPQVGEGSPR